MFNNILGSSLLFLLSFELTLKQEKSKKGEDRERRLKKLKFFGKIKKKKKSQQFFSRIFDKHKLSFLN